MRALHGDGVGHEPREFIEMVSAQQDLEDSQAEARDRAAYNRWLVQRSERTSADMSAPSEMDKAELAEWQKRARKFREKQTVINLARRAVAMDLESERR